VSGADLGQYSDIFFLAAVGVVAVAVIVLLVVLYQRRLREAHGETATLRRRASLSEAKLAAAPLGYFAFASSGGGIDCSESLARALGLSDGDASDFGAITRCFAKADAQRLSEAALRLRGEGARFAMTLQHADGVRSFRVSGSRAYGAPEGVQSDVIWFEDVSESSEALAQAEAERDDYASLLDAVPLPIWVRGGDEDLVYCNQAYARAVDRDRATVIEQGIELPGTALAEVSRAIAQRAQESHAAAAEAHHVVVEGERRLLELSERPFGQGMLAGLARDLTAVEEAEDQTARHVEAHAEILEGLSSGIAIFGADMRLKFFNTAYARMWRLDERFLNEEPHYGDILEMLRERRRLPEQPNFPVFKKEEIARHASLINPIEELLHIPDGSTFRKTVTPHPFGGVLFSFEDVTDRLALERSYNTLIDVQRETLDNLYEGIAVYGADGRLKLFNPAFARIWDLPQEFLSGEPHVREVIPRTRDFFDVADGDWPALMDNLVIASTEPELTSGRLERADGSVLDTAQVPLPDGACLFTYLDVTDSIRVERALRERNEALETTDRLKSEFIANVSYELRTPLNAIVGFAEILENQFFGELNERQLEYSRAIVESSQRLLTLINDILDLATIEAGYLRLDLGPVDVAALLESIQTLGHERARNRGIEFRLDCPSDAGEMVADERRVKQALFNLVSNAFKFTPEGGQVTVSARRVGQEVQLAVVDTGIGIPQEEHARVFGKFERGGSQGRQSGAGLGLSLVKSLIELHGGWVELDSAPQEGTRVTCHLPVTAQATVLDHDDDSAPAALVAPAPAREPEPLPRVAAARHGSD